MKEEKYIICVDPGTRDWGYVVFDLDFNIVEFKTVHLDTEMSQEQRYYEIFKIVDNLFYTYPAKILLTEFQFPKNTDVLIRVLGILGLLSAKWEVEIRYISAASWKKWAVGNHLADKKEGIAAIRNKYPELAKASEHVCDAACFGESYKLYPKIALKEKSDKSEKPKFIPRRKRKTS